MNKELELKLVEKYPNILCDYGGDMKKTCMHWGMECCDGWYDLLDELLAKLDYLSTVSGVQVVADQIKEKFGTLRFYYSTVAKTDSNLDVIVCKIIDDIVDRAEKRSSYICEKTGKTGVLCSRFGWLSTLCKKEAENEGFAPVDPQIAKYWDKLDNKSLNEDH
jgi:hypothetical protein